MDDLKQAYVLGANSYLVKANTFDGLCDQFKFIYGYWMRVRVPPIGPAERLLEIAQEVSEKSLQQKTSPGKK